MRCEVKQLTARTDEPKANASEKLTTNLRRARFVGERSAVGVNVNLSLNSHLRIVDFGRRKD